MPSTVLHDNANQDANRLPKALGALGVYCSEESIDGRVRLKLPDDASQRSPVVVDLRFLHALLAVFVVEERKYFFEPIIRIVDHVGERSAQRIVKKFFFGNGDARHFRIP
ncbi:MAG: hypothetical protein A2W31_12600 [Planctomycetes bacterium RBG_16_64_10]|nr:MAG: hypothetical protein A2W31_12600 [Planctomycetes bacterium RBG_16_64_10]